MGADEYVFEKGTIFGEVTDVRTGDPLDAEVTAKCKGFRKRQVHTDSSGGYSLADLLPGKWKLKVKAKRCKKARAKVNLSAGEEREQDFKLKCKK